MITLEKGDSLECRRAPYKGGAFQTWCVCGPLLCAEIYYASNQELDWQRIVVCKELVHLFDPENATTKIEAELRHLTEMMALSPELQFQKDDEFKVFTDKFWLGSGS